MQTCTWLVIQNMLHNVEEPIEVY